MKIIDISTELTSSLVYPGDPKPMLEQIAGQDSGLEYNLSVLHTCVHIGTHVDVPRHFYPDGLDAAAMPLQMFIGICRIAIIAGGELDKLSAMQIPCDCERMLLCSNGTGWLSPDAAQYFAEKGICLLGTDNLSIGGGDFESTVHRILLGKGVAILEGLCLSHVPEGCYYLTAPPLKIAGADGSPVRAVLLDGFLP